MKVFLHIAGLVLLAACRSETTGDAASATGTLEYVEIHVAPLVPGRVVRIAGREGDAVHVGDTLVVLTQGNVQPNIDAQQARVRVADARLRQLVSGTRSTDVERASAELRAAQSEVGRTSRDVERLAPLAERGTISRQQLDVAQSASRLAAARRDAAQQVLGTLQSGPRRDEIDAGRAELATAQAVLRGATASQADMVLTAPIAGTVITRASEPGEVVVPGAPTMTLADVTRPFVRVFVNQAVLPGIQIGDSVSALLDAYPGKPFRGRIAAVANTAEFTPRVALTRDERADLLFAIRIEFLDTTRMLKAGLPVTVRFTPGPPR